MTNAERLADLERKVDALSTAVQALLRGGIAPLRQIPHDRLSLGGTESAWGALREAGLAPAANDET
jgi:hypothetical protein